MPLESGKRRAYPPMGKGCAQAESLRRPMRVDDRGGGTQRYPLEFLGPTRREMSPVFHHDQPNFADRHIGPDADAVSTMLKAIGVGSLDELADKALPAGILDALSGDVAPGLDQLLPAASEYEALAELREM